MKSVLFNKNKKIMDISLGYFVFRYIDSKRIGVRDIGNIKDYPVVIGKLGNVSVCIMINAWFEWNEFINSDSEGNHFQCSDTYVQSDFLTYAKENNLEPYIAEVRFAETNLNNLKNDELVVSLRDKFYHPINVSLNKVEHIA